MTALRSLARSHSSQHGFGHCLVATRQKFQWHKLGIIVSEEQVHKFSARWIGEIPNLILRHHGREVLCELAEHLLGCITYEQNHVRF